MKTKDTGTQTEQDLSSQIALAELKITHTEDIAVLKRQLTAERESHAQTRVALSELRLALSDQIATLQSQLVQMTQERDKLQQAVWDPVLHQPETNATLSRSSSVISVSSGESTSGITLEVPTLAPRPRRSPSAYDVMARSPVFTPIVPDDSLNPEAAVSINLHVPKV